MSERWTLALTRQPDTDRLELGIRVYVDLHNPETAESIRLRAGSLLNRWPAPASFTAPTLEDIRARIG